MRVFFLRPQALVRFERLIRDASAMCGFIALFCFGSVFLAASQEPPKGLSKDQVIRLLKEDPALRVQFLINKYGIAFYLAPDAENELRDAGATPELLDLVRRLAPQKPAEIKPPPPPPTLVINAKPGEAEVYVDDERRGQTGTDGTLKLGDLASGSHKLRISAAGFHSFEVNVELTAGQINMVVAELQPFPPPLPPKEETTAKENSKSMPPENQKLRGDPDDPLSPHAPGIYYLEQIAGVNHLTELGEAPPASRAPQMGIGTAFSVMYGGAFGGAKWKSQIFGSMAHLRVPPGRAVFYFSFPTVDAVASPSGPSNGAFRDTSTPNNFLLVHLRSQKNSREIPAKNSATATVDEKNIVSFDYVKEATGTYKVQVKSDLGPGEYGFLYGGCCRRQRNPGCSTSELIDPNDSAGSG